MEAQARYVGDTFDPKVQIVPAGQFASGHALVVLWFLHDVKGSSQYCDVVLDCEVLLLEDALDLLSDQLVFQKLFIHAACLLVCC